MSVELLPADSIGHNFIPSAYLPEGKDEFHIRNEQLSGSLEHWRHLRSHEVERLVKNGNYANNWDEIYVTDGFDPNLMRNSEFWGLVRIGRLRNAVLEHHDLKVRTGVTNSTIVACDLGDDVGVHNVRYLAHYIIGNRCILTNIDEMHTSNHAKFGNGIIKDGEREDVRIWLDIMNEAGSRQVLPFDGMISADAYLWAKYQDDVALQNSLKKITQSSFDSQRGYYGIVGDHSVIKNSRIIKDVKVGSYCYIKGTNKLKNLTVHSNEAEPTQIGEGVELVLLFAPHACAESIPGPDVGFTQLANCQLPNGDVFWIVARPYDLPRNLVEEVERQKASVDHAQRVTSDSRAKPGRSLVAMTCGSYGNGHRFLVEYRAGDNVAEEAYIRLDTDPGG